MDIFERNPVMTIDDVVFEAATLRLAVEKLMEPRGAKRTLFYGEAGTGKTTLCNIIAEHLVGEGHVPDIKIINVSRHCSKSALCDEIEQFRGFGALNSLGKAVVILEELDGAEPRAQLALKVLLEEQSEHKLFLATTNSLDGIIEPVRDRFKKVHIARPQPTKWITRAQSILQNEGVKITDEVCLQLLEDHAAGASGRAIMNLLDDFAQRVKANQSAANVSTAQSH